MDREKKEEKPNRAGRAAREPKTAAERGEARLRIARLKESVEAPKLIGTPEELIPFVWRYPLRPANPKKTTRLLRTLAQQEAERQRAAVQPGKSGARK